MPAIRRTAVENRSIAFCGLNIRMALEAKFAARAFHQLHRGLSGFRLGVASGAGVALEGRVQEVIDQLGAVGTVRIVTFAAAAAREGLASVRLLDAGLRGVVAGEAQVWLRRRQMEDALRLAGRFALVRGVAGGAAHLHGRVLDRLLQLRGDVFVAAQAKILGGLTIVGRLPKEIGVRAAVRLVTGDAGFLVERRMQGKLPCLGPLVLVAGVAKSVAFRRQGDVDLLAESRDRMAGVAAHLDRGVNGRAGGFCGMTILAGTKIGSFPVRTGFDLRVLGTRDRKASYAD